MGSIWTPKNTVIKMQTNSCGYFISNPWVLNKTKVYFTTRSRPIMHSSISAIDKYKYPDASTADQSAKSSHKLAHIFSLVARYFSIIRTRSWPCTRCLPTSSILLRHSLSNIRTSISLLSLLYINLYFRERKRLQQWF